jgi:hypothetical protein
MGEVEILQQQIQLLNERIKILEQMLQSNQKEMIKQALSEFNNQKKDPLKEEFLRRFTKNKKQLIKQKIVESVRIKPTNVADLKYYIVDQLNYCSKASFYRYIMEMKDLVEIKEDVAYLVKELSV